MNANLWKTDSGRRLRTLQALIAGSGSPVQTLMGVEALG